MSQDAIEYITPAAHLLALTPRTWLQTLMREHRAKHHYTPRGAWASDINVSSGSNGITSFSADGEVGFHKDPDFYRYGYILLLRPAGYNVTGIQNWRGLNPQQQPGDLICFHQKRRLHGLVKHGTARADAGHLHADDSSIWSDHPGRLWCALTFDDQRLLAPEEAVEEYGRRLNRLPVNRKR